ncbi:unnamed protein product [Gadus morhua 'NCC']
MRRAGNGGEKQESNQGTPFNSLKHRPGLDSLYAGPKWPFPRKEPGPKLPHPNLNAKFPHRHQLQHLLLPASQHPASFSLHLPVKHRIGRTRPGRAEAAPMVALWMER